MPSHVTPESPRIVTLRQELEQGIAQAVDAFWAEIERIGAPLVEAIPGDAAHTLVTFLWRETEGAEEPVETIIVVGEVVGWDFARNQMKRLGETDLWYRSYLLPSDARTAYWLARNDPLTPMPEEADPPTRWASWQPDPLNRRNQTYSANEEDPNDQEFSFSVLELPNAPAQPWIEPGADTPTGAVTKHRFVSERLGNERSVWVYTPPGYAATPTRPYPLLVVLDGWGYTHITPTPTILDNLIAARQIPPMVAAFVGNVDRNLELPCHAPFADFLASELVPWLREGYAIAHDPNQAIIAGLSYGGLAASFIGLRHAETFGNVLSQSGAFWWRPSDEDEHGWLIRQFVETPRLPLRFSMDVGAFEHGVRDPSILLYNQHMRDVLRAKSYPVTYQQYSGGHDFICWQGTFADDLRALTDAPEFG